MASTHLTIGQQVTGGKKEFLTYPLKKLPRTLDLDIAKENLLLVHKVFTERKIKFWLMFGTLLGAVREGNFIEWDHDVDVGVLADDFGFWFPALTELQEEGFEIIRTIVDKGKDCLVTILRKNYYIDFYVMSRYRRGWCFGNRYELKDYYSEFIEVKFLGEWFLIPSRLDEWLIEHYGKDWQVPKKNFIGNLRYKKGTRHNEYRKYIRGGV